MTDTTWTTQPANSSYDNNGNCTSVTLNGQTTTLRYPARGGSVARAIRSSRGIALPSLQAAVNASSPSA